MWKIAGGLVVVVSLVATRAAAPAPPEEAAASSPDARPIPRVRSTDGHIAALMARASEQSATFRRLVRTITATDGIVYVQAGRCTGVHACLALRVTVATPHRILWILVDPARAPCDVMASIGHELQHAIEVLREPSITSDGDLYFFLTKGRSPNPPAWVETEAAVKAGEDVLTELRTYVKERGQTCAKSQSMAE